MKKSEKLYLFLIFLILYTPILILVLFSFNSSGNTGSFTGFSLYWYKELFKSPATFTALKNTLILALSAAAASTLIGTAAAVGIGKMRSKIAKGAVLSLTNVPMMSPDIVTGISMMLLFVFVGALVNVKEVLGFATLLIAHVTFCLPYVILNVMPKLRQFDMNVYEAALDLGCKPFKAFMKVVMPEIMNGIITGCIMSFTLSLDDFIISYFTNGPSFQTLPIYIFSLTKKRVKPDMFALSTLMFLVILVLLIFMNVAQTRAEKKEAAK